MNLVISSAHIFVIFWLFGTVMFSGDFSSELMSQFGFVNTNAVMVSLTVFSLLLSPIEQIMRLLMTMLSRRNEYEADSFAVLKGRAEALCSGLMQIQNENKGEMNPDPWYSWYHYSHPHVTERLRAIREQAKKSE